MKIRLIIITLAFITIDAYSQITVTDNDIISVGDIIYEASDYSTGSAIVIGNAGANQIWDFSSLQALEIDTIEVLSPVGTPFESLHPNANLCVNIDDELLSNEGITDFSIYRMDVSKQLWKDFFVPKNTPQVEPLLDIMNPN